MTTGEKATIAGAIFGGLALGIGGYQAGASRSGSVASELADPRVEQVTSALVRERAARTAAEAVADSVRAANLALMRELSSLRASTAAPAAPSPAETSEPPSAPVAAQGCSRNLTFQCATLLGMGSRDADVFDLNERYYRIELAQPGSVTFTLDPMPNTRWVALTIYDSGYEKVAFKRFEQGQPGSFAVNLRQPGRYYATLYPAPCCSGAPYNYAFTVSR